jgi:hypothetical protein
MHITHITYAQGMRYAQGRICVFSTVSVCIFIAYGLYQVHWRLYVVTSPGREPHAGSASRPDRPGDPYRVVSWTRYGLRQPGALSPTLQGLAVGAKGNEWQHCRQARIRRARIRRSGAVGPWLNGPPSVRGLSGSGCRAGRGPGVGRLRRAAGLPRRRWRGTEAYSDGAATRTS